MRFFWFMTALAATAALVALVGGLLMARGAPQQAAVAAIALCVAAIPYIFTRALEGFAAADFRRDVREALKRIGGPPAS